MGQFKKNIEIDDTIYNKVGSFQTSDVDISIKQPNEEKYDVLFDVCQVVVRSRTVEWNIQNIIPNNKLVMMFGASASGKSFVAIDMVLSMIALPEWHTHVVIPGSAVYVACEGRSALELRTKAWFQSKNLDPTQHEFLVTKRSIQFADDDLNNLIEDIEKMENSPRIIVIDTLSRATIGMDENSSYQMMKFIDDCEKLKNKFNCTVLIIHHSGHQGERARGASSIKSAVDLELFVSKNNDIISLECKKDRDHVDFDKLNFVLDTIELPESSGWRNSDGTLVKSAVLRRVENEQLPDTHHDTNQLILGILEDCFENEDLDIKIISGIETPVLNKFHFVSKCIDSGIFDGVNTETQKKYMRDEIKKMVKLKQINIYDKYLYR